MADPASRCPGPDACAWPRLCPPARCIADETADSPHYARFLPREESGEWQPRSPRRVLPSGPEHRGISPWRRWAALCLAVGPEILAGMMLGALLFCAGIGLGEFWGVF